MQIAKDVLDDFKKFIIRGNVIDLAVGVVVGASFSNVINSFVRDILTPFIAALVRQPDFSGLAFTINNSKFMYGSFLNTLISFLIAATVVYFFIVLPINKISSFHKKIPPKQEPPLTLEQQLLTEIRDLLKEQASAKKKL